jgi:hypothetical protein
MLVCHRTGWVVLVLGWRMFFVVVYGPGRVHQRLQCGAVGLSWCYYARQMADDRAVVDMAARSQVPRIPICGIGSICAGVALGFDIILRDFALKVRSILVSFVLVWGW